MEADSLFVNAQVFNAYLKRFVSASVAVLDGKFLYVGDAKSAGVQAKTTVDLQGRWMVPGLIDSHMHIESSMAAPQTFARALVKNGVTTIVAEPHEIANVFGVEGVRALVRAAEGSSVDVLIGVPSSVPSTGTLLETSGAEIGLSELDELLDMDGVICLGEVMNYRDVIHDPNSKSNQLIRRVKECKPHLAIEGHCPRLQGLDLARFLFAGVDSDHTEQTVEGMLERIANGMFVQLQDKSLCREIVDCVVAQALYEHVALATDDVMPDALLERGHLNYLVKKAIGLGMPPEMAVYAASFTPARRMGLRDRGAIAPGKLADFVVLDDLAAFSVVSTYKNGSKVYDVAAKTEMEKRDASFPPHFYRSVHVPLLNEAQFAVTAPVQNGEVACRVMMVQDGTTFTKEEQVVLPVRDGKLDWENSSFCLAAVFERHGKNGGIGIGLVGGDALKSGAVATTYAHDHHNLLVIGQCARDMVVAANRVIEEQGGYCVVADGAVIAETALSIAGILSDKPLAELGRELADVKTALAQLGYQHSNVIMSISTLSLPVSPALKLSDKGLIRVNEQKLVPLFL